MRRRVEDLPRDSWAVSALRKVQNESVREWKEIPCQVHCHHKMVTGLCARSGLVKQYSCPHASHPALAIICRKAVDVLVALLILQSPAKLAELAFLPNKLNMVF